jgi:hypothetical protein
MIRLFAIWCVGLLSTFTVSSVEGHPTDEKAEDTPRLYSTPVRVGGADFEVAARSTWERPGEIYGTFEPKIDLRISNRTDKELTFKLGDALRVSLKTAYGPEMVSHPIPKRHFPKPFKVAAGETKTITLPIEFVHTRIHHVSLGAKSDHEAGTNWLSSDILPGSYRLCLSLENSCNSDDAWVGKMRTETLDIEVRAAE